MNSLSFSLFSIVLINICHSFYLPGVAPHEYNTGDRVRVKVNKLESIQTQLPYDYYKLPFCKPEHHVKRDVENLGEILSGDTIETSPYQIQMDMPVECQALCKKKYAHKDLVHFSKKIEEKYRVNLIVDNLPAAQKFQTIVSDGKHEHKDYIYEKGYPLGAEVQQKGDRVVLLNNHVDLIILYHHDDRYEGHRIVGFEIQPRSINHQIPATWNENEMSANNLDCSTQELLRIANPQIPENGKEVIWSYSVDFEPSEVRWASRWDAYLKMQDPQIHWFSILNSFMIVIFLSGMVAMILMRALHKDLRRYNSEPDDLDQEETGWKLVHGDVFRTPDYPSIFSSLIGTGVQVFIMCLLTIIFAALGFLSPANRGSLMTTLLLLYVFMGIFSGYYSARCYKMFGETDWQRQTLQTAILFPGINFIVFFVLDLFVWHEGSSGAVPFTTMFSLLIMWFGISVPLVYLGAYFGYKKDPPPFPCETNELARIIPPQPWYMQKYFAILIGGVLPFGAVFIEVFFIMSSIWLHHYYYMFGFLLLVYVILILTSAEITIVMTYFQLCAEDHQWWWRSIFTAGSSALYLFLYSIVYFYTKLDIGGHFVSLLLYFGYMFLVSFAFFIVTGTVGFYATFLFVKKIYSEIKIE